MEVDCDKKINEKENYEEKDRIESNVENVEERTNVIQPCDMDKMLEDCHKYLNECEEVLQDCAKYLEDCEDTDINMSISEENSEKEDLNLPVDEHSNMNGDNYKNVTKPTEPIPNAVDDINEFQSLTESFEGKITKNNCKGNGDDDNVIVNGNLKELDELKTMRVNNEVNANKTYKENDIENKNTIISDSKMPGKENQTNETDCTNLKEDPKSGDNGIISDGVKSRKCKKEAKEQLIDSIKVHLNQSETESDDSIMDNEEEVNLVPLRILEECDGEVDKIKDETDQSLMEGNDEHSTEMQKMVSSDDVNMCSDQVVLKEPMLDQDVKVAEEKRITSGEVVEQNVSSSRFNGKSNQDEDDEKISSETVPREGSQDQLKQADQVNQEIDAERDRKEAALQDKMKILEEELSSTRKALKLAHRHHAEYQAKSNNIVMSLKLELYKAQAARKKERVQNHNQLSDVISHLTLLEGNLRKGQMKHKRELKAKHETIEKQETEILKLREQNEQLLNAIKEICANGGMNGYMRGKHSSHSEKKGSNGKLGMVKDKFLMKNRSSLELNNFNLEKFNLKNQRLYSSQEDLKNLHDDAFEQNSPGHDKGGSFFRRTPNTSIRGSKHGNKNHRKNLQNYFTEPETPKREMQKSSSDSSQISDTSSGVFSMSDQELHKPTSAGINGHNDHFDDDDDDDDEDDDDEGRIFSFSSTHINTVIDEEEALGPIVSHSGQMMSMGSMPMLAQGRNDPGHMLYTSKDRPHSLSSVDLLSIQRQAEKLSKLRTNETIDESSVTPPPSPSYNNNNKPDSGKSEMTPFQTFKTMFKRKGSKNKGNKKRSVSLTQTSNNEYSEALKKHFQKYDMH